MAYDPEVIITNSLAALRGASTWPMTLTNCDYFAHGAASETEFSRHAGEVARISGRLMKRS
jgi:hypothetical protein